LTAVCCVLSATVSAQEIPSTQVNEPSPKDRETDAKAFSLQLANEQLDPNHKYEATGFLLGLTDGSVTEPQTTDRPYTGHLEFSLHTGVGEGERSLPGIGLEFYEQLAAGRWPDGKSRLGVHLAAENAGAWGRGGGMAHLYGGAVGTVGYLDFVALAHLIIEWWKAEKLKQLPAGASIPLDATLTLRVSEPGGGLPDQISVIPLTEGWIGDVVHAGCDDRGRCVVEGLPSASSTLLVRGNGESLVCWDHFQPELFVVLKPTGWLQVIPKQHSGICCPIIRVLDQDSEAIVPIMHWINPGREDWVRVPPSGLRLTLPEGRYRIQTSQHYEGSFVDTAVMADRLSTVEVLY
jgi:hypothetical protein